MLRSSIILAVAWVTVGHVTYTQSQQRDDPTGPASHHGEEWPRWRGPRGNGTWHAPKLLDKWPAGGLQRTWATPLGGGYAGVAAKGQRIFTMDRQTTPQDRERVVCFHASDGKPLWTHEYPINYGKLEYGNGPRATPTIYDNRVYTLGALGHLWCLDAANGKPFWTAQLARDYQGRMPTWGYAASPLVVGDLVYVRYGDNIPVDGVVVRASDFEVNEASLTGEPDDLKKNSETPCVFTGTGFVFRCSQKHQGESTPFRILASDFHQTQFIHKEIQGGIQVEHPYHRMKVTHLKALPLVLFFRESSGTLSRCFPIGFGHPQPAPIIDAETDRLLDIRFTGKKGHVESLGHLHEHVVHKQPPHSNHVW